jgi:hypothetical protein
MHPKTLMGLWVKVVVSYNLGATTGLLTITL